MQVRDCMTPSPITVPPTMSVGAARDLMDTRHIRHLLVGDGEGLVGIVTDRDLRLHPRRPISRTVWERGQALDQLAVADVMTRAVITVGASRPVETAAEMLLEHRIGALPVLEGGRVVGILTATDLLRVLVRRRLVP
jgi:CBS domain-containing protein